MGANVRLNKEREEKRKEKAEARLYTIIKVARDEDLGEQIGKEIYFDLVNHDKVCTFRIKKDIPFTQFKEEVAKAFGIPVQFQRYWLWYKRNNHTYRPYRALTAQEEIHSVGQLRGSSNEVNNAELKLFLEVELCLEIKFEPSVCCEKIDSMLSFCDYQLEDGDIICFQKSLRNQCRKQYRFPEVPLFLKYVYNCKFKVRIGHDETEQKAEACLYTMIKVARDENLGEQIGKEIYFDLVNHDKVRTFRMQKQMPFTKFKEEVAKAFGIPVQFQRYWLWKKRENHTYRPDRALTSQEEIQYSVGQLRENSNTVNNTELKLFLEVILCPEIRFEPNVMCLQLNNMLLSLRDCHLDNGDIICFQKSLRNKCSKQYRFPNVPSFLKYVHNRQLKGHEKLVPRSHFPSNRPRLQVEAETVSMDVDAVAVDSPVSARFTWTVHNFSKLNRKNSYSDAFNVGRYQWRILIVPKGNNGDHLSLYLTVVNTAALPYGWIRYTQFSLAVLNQIDDNFTVRKDTQLQFTARMREWGFISFMPLTELYDPGRGYLVDDKVILEAYVTLPKSKSLIIYSSPM
ncbi:ubiquitin C-terminal hydrolase 12-like [Solanum stenotomum]|uniref:ubiquitin C-terminal hydrolase 12-like n=1 Tax=Solanum stenotomum TaxID=172797 RepID=UPI0020D1B76C|nr:ubiquitin C-terminal hydrolase 12-like [Solanum stenotomum]